MSENYETLDETVEGIDGPESFDLFGETTLTVGEITFPAPDKYQPGHVMTADEAAHYSNFVRSRCQANMISLEKRGKVPAGEGTVAAWTPELAAAFYAEYLPGAPRGRGPSLEEIHDEALTLLVKQLAEFQGAATPRGKAMSDAKAKVDASPKMQSRIAELESEVIESYREKAREEAKVKAPSLDLDSLL